MSPHWNSVASGPNPLRVLLLEEVRVEGEQGVLTWSHFWEWGRWAWEAQPHELELDPDSQQASTEKAAVRRASWNRCHHAPPGVQAVSL